MKTTCENCAQALARLYASRETPGPAVGEMQHCPDCGDRRFLVYELVSITQETKLEAPVFMREHTTFTVPVGYEVPQCNCGRTPDYSHTEYTNGFRRFDVYQCGHGGKL